MRFLCYYGQFKITDGPFIQSKEIAGGFALVNAKSLQEAIEDTKNFVEIAGNRETEVRQLYEQSAK